MDWTGGRAVARMILYGEMAENSDTLRAVQRASKALDVLDGKLARARAACDKAQAARDAAAAELARAQAALDAPAPEPRRHFTRSEIAAAQARGR